MSRKRMNFREGRNVRENQLPSPLDGFASEAPSDHGTSGRAVVEAEPALPLPLAEVLSSVAPFEWRDAVAIVLQLVDQLSPDGLEPDGTFPDVDHIALAPGGFLLTQLEPRGTVPLAGLGRLLQHLLAEATPPPPLRLLAIQAASAKPTLSFADLNRELSEWARPYRHRLLEILANLYQRAHDQAATSAVPSLAYHETQVPVSRARFRMRPLPPRVVAGLGLGAGALAVAGLLILGADARESAAPARTEVAAGGETQPTAPQPIDVGPSRETARAQVEPAAESRPSTVIETLRNGVRQLSGDDVMASTSSTPSPRPPATTPRPPATAPPAAPRPSPTRPPATTASTSVDPAPRPSPMASATTASASASPAPRPSPVASAATTASASVSPASRPSPMASVTTASASASPPPRPSPAAPAAMAAASPVSSAPQLAAADSDLAGYSTTILREAELEFRRARALFDEREYAVAADRFLQVVKILDRGDPALGLRSIASEFAGASRALASHDAADSSRVYTSADEGVTEPVTVATLPRPVEPGTPADQRAVLELLIDARGGVESAHLIDVEQHFRDRWWMSAAKAWLFKPAMKDGQPVRFLKRVVFTASDSASPR